MIDCKEWTKSCFPNGYGQRKAYGEQYAHRAEWVKHHGTIPDGLDVLHRCDNRPCYEISHLFLGTPADNTEDMIGKRRHSYGERHPNSKTTVDNVREMRHLRANGTTLAVLSKKFCLSKAQVSNICRMKAWKEETT